MQSLFCSRDVTRLEMRARGTRMDYQPRRPPALLVWYTQSHSPFTFEDSFLYHERARGQENLLGRTPCRIVKPCVFSLLLKAEFELKIYFNIEKEILIN